MLVLAPLLALSLAPGAAPQDAPPLLPDAIPEDWRGERLELPLSFAPDLGLAGYEVLRFHPGMFDPASEGYWSYAFGLRLEGEHAVDAAFLERFLRGYYTGLCRSVAGDRFDLSDHEFTFDVRRADGRWQADLGIVDAFVTGEPLELAFEVAVHPRAGGTDLFAIASPAEEDAEVWGTLRGALDGWVASRPPTATLNHVFFVVDDATYEALVAAEFLRGPFAAGETRETVRRDMRYSGLYLYGDTTYFEFLPAGAAPQLFEGATGVALGFDRPGEQTRAREALDAVDVTTFPRDVTRALGGQQLPWFQALGVQAAHEASRIAVFGMEYDRRFLARWNGDADEGRGVARREVLDRYRAVLGQEPGAFADVTAVHLALDARERDHLRTALTALGWRAVEEEGALRLDGPGCDLVIRSSAEPGRLTGLELALRRELEPRTLELGAVTLDVAGSRAALVVAEPGR